MDREKREFQIEEAVYVKQKKEKKKKKKKKRNSRVYESQSLRCNSEFQKVLRAESIGQENQIQSELIGVLHLSNEFRLFFSYYTDILSV